MAETSKNWKWNWQR